MAFALSTSIGCMENSAVLHTGDERTAPVRTEKVETILEDIAWVVLLACLHTILCTWWSELDRCMGFSSREGVRGSWRVLIFYPANNNARHGAARILRERHP
jgi:hypothetical protein